MRNLSDKLLGMIQKIAAEGLGIEVQNDGIKFGLITIGDGLISFECERNNATDEKLFIDFLIQLSQEINNSTDD